MASDTRNHIGCANYWLNLIVAYPKHRRLINEPVVGDRAEDNSMICNTSVMPSMNVVAAMTEPNLLHTFNTGLVSENRPCLVDSKVYFGFGLREINAGIG